MPTKLKSAFHTIFQAAVGLAAGMPVILDASGLAQTWAGAGTALIVSGIVTGAMDSTTLRPVLSRLGLSTVKPEPSEADE